MLSFKKITMRFGGVIALDDVSADFNLDIVGLIGPNGAGKTTLLNILSGFLRPSLGKIFLDQALLNDLSANKRAKKGLRRTFQQERVVESLSVVDNIRAVADHLGSHNWENEIERALRTADLWTVSDQKGETLDMFNRRKTELAKAIVGNPKLILMDEPSAGLTETESAKFRDILIALPAQTGAQVVIIDHDTQLISDVCEETMVLDFGRMLAFGETETVLKDPIVRRAYMGED